MGGCRRDFTNAGMVLHDRFRIVTKDTLIIQQDCFY